RPSDARQQEILALSPRVPRIFTNLISAILLVRKYISGSDDSEHKTRMRLQVIKNTAIGKWMCTTHHCYFL
ncbi:hypothetical protein BGZ46_005385, partial [Entomortierella lignicola]